MHHHTLAPIVTARELVRTERDQLRTERATFESFADRVDTIDEQSAAVPVGSARQSVVPAQRGEPAMGRLRSAFRETVMAVPHYDDVYEESLAGHAAGEFGPEIAAGLCSDIPVSPAFTSAFLEAIERGIENRSAVLDLLDTEATSLASAQSTLETVARAVHEHAMSEDRSAQSEGNESLSTIECRCQSVVEERQALIQSRDVSPVVDGHDFCAYLYGDIARWTYPVLVVATSLKRDVDALEYRPTSCDPMV